MAKVGTTEELIVTVTELDVTLAGDAHAREEVRVQVTAAPAVSEEVIKVALLVPAFVPFIFHWKDGVEPPLVTWAANVSGAPLQIDAARAVIEIVGVCVPTVIVIALDVTVSGDAHGALEVMTQDTTCPVVNVVVVYAGLLVPTLTVPTFHW
jgi:hypothetical protein